MASVRVFGHYLRLPYLVLGSIEAGLFAAAVYAGVHLRFLGGGSDLAQSVRPILPPALVFASVVLISMISMGLYELRLRDGVLGIVLRTVVSLALAIFGLAVVFYTVPSLYFGGPAFAFAIVVSFLGAVAVRSLFAHLVDRDVLKRNVLVIGAGPLARYFQGLRRRSDRRGFNLVGYLRVDGEQVAIDHTKILQPAASLLALSQQRKIDEIVVAASDRRKNLPMTELLDCRLSGVAVSDALTFFEREAGKLVLELIHPSSLVFGGGFKRRTKRLFDVGVASVLFVAMLPVMVVAALAILAESGGKHSVFYRQRRIGQGGKSFRLVKFRSMRVDAEADGKARWADRNDRRATRVGRLIRKLRVDELPQLYNVLRGDMSLVGPRPERPEFVGELAKKFPYYAERHRVKPGITGWAQVRYPYGASERDAKEKLQYDLFYVKNHSLFLDLLIVARTVEVVLFGRGAR
jgi:sugar transferase (PEP-CTERM system associated)